MAEVRIKDIEEHEIDTILADDIDFEGKLTFKKPLMIRGKFRGEINSPSALYVGEKAVVEARVEAGLVSSKGRIKGDIIGHNRVELSSTANVDGDISTPDFVVESGCKFNGICNMGSLPKKTAAAPQPSAGQAAAPQAAAPKAATPQAAAPQPAAPAAAQPAAPQPAAQPAASQQGGQHGGQPQQGQRPNQGGGQSQQGQHNR